MKRLNKIKYILNPSFVVGSGEKAIVTSTLSCG
jgi:hypothetical protein